MATSGTGTPPDGGLAERYAAGRELALRAGALAAGYASRLAELDVRWKGAQDVVTEADLEVELLIKRDLADFGDGFLGEETGAAGLADAEGVWVIDPIDGTQPFVSGLPSWCVSIAYVHRGVLQFGFVHNPPLDELFEGGRDRPGLLNGRPVAPHPGRVLTDGIVSAGYSPRLGADDVLPVLDRLLRQGGTFYRNGSGALSLCYVACGRLLGYIEPHMNSWDCLGALAVIHSAGGRTNDFLTGDALLTGNRIVAGAPAVYAALDAVLGPHGRSLRDMSIRLGYQIPNFSYGTPRRDLFPTVIAQAREAEAAGFDAVLVMDHFYQLPGLGRPDEPMLEAYTALGALATATERVQLSTLVTGNTYRQPTLLAKAVTTLDVVSGGRAVLGIGAGWFELEHHQLGFEFGTFTERFQRLDEALQIIAPMLRGDRPTFDGAWYHTESAINEPRVRDDLPIMLGGGGEKKTFGLAARFADHLNIICDPAELPRKLDAVAERCAEVGRDRASLETSALVFAMVDEDGDAARAAQRDYLRGIGTDPDALSEEEFRAATARHFVGTPDDVAEDLQRRVLDPGVDGVIVNLVADGHRPGVVSMVGDMLHKLLG